MQKGPIITACVAAVAMVGVVSAFLSNASPYVTLAQAKKSTGDHLHLAGDLVPNSIHNDLASRHLSFQIKDSDGAVATVDYTGEKVNLAEATKVVAIGSLQGDRFVSDKLLVKCPSKYEAQDQSSAVARG